MKNLEISPKTARKRKNRKGKRNPEQATYKHRVELHTVPEYLAREAAIIARLDEAIGGAPKLTHAPEYSDEDLRTDYKALGRLLGLKASHRMKEERVLKTFYRISEGKLLQ